VAVAVVDPLEVVDVRDDDTAPAGLIEDTTTMPTYPSVTRPTSPPKTMIALAPPTTQTNCGTSTQRGRKRPQYSDGIVNRAAMSRPLERSAWQAAASTMMPLTTRSAATSTHSDSDGTLTETSAMIARTQVRATNATYQPPGRTMPGMARAATQSPTARPRNALAA
jgi:hypothetical protein